MQTSIKSSEHIFHELSTPSSLASIFLFGCPGPTRKSNGASLHGKQSSKQTWTISSANCWGTSFTWSSHGWFKSEPWQLCWNCDGRWKHDWLWWVFPTIVPHFVRCDAIIYHVFLFVYLQYFRVIFHFQEWNLKQQNQQPEQTKPIYVVWSVNIHQIFTQDILFEALKWTCRK